MKNLKQQPAAAYLDCVNNYLSVDLFAAAYGITEKQAHDLIALGRSIHEAGIPASPPPVKTYTVIAVSSNANSFGYKSVLCLAEDGEGFEGLVQAYSTDKVPVRGDVVRKDESRWYCAPRALPEVSPEQAREILADVRKSKS